MDPTEAEGTEMWSDDVLPLIPLGPGAAGHLQQRDTITK